MDRMCIADDSTNRPAHLYYIVHISTMKPPEPVAGNVPEFSVPKNPATNDPESHVEIHKGLIINKEAKFAQPFLMTGQQQKRMTIHLLYFFKVKRNKKEG